MDLAIRRLRRPFLAAAAPAPPSRTWLAERPEGHAALKAFWAEVLE